MFRTRSSRAQSSQGAPVDGAIAPRGLRGASRRAIRFAGDGRETYWPIPPPASHSPTRPPNPPTHRPPSPPCACGPRRRRGTAGSLTLLRFMRANHMLTRDYARMLARCALLKLRLARRLQTDGLCFICPGVQLEIGRDATLRIGRWAWIGHGCKIRVHEGEVRIGAKTVIGQECTISAFQHVVDRARVHRRRSRDADRLRPRRRRGRAPDPPAGHLQARRRRRAQRLDRLRRVRPARGRASATTA